jgi:hypothetical protein
MPLRQNSSVVAARDIRRGDDLRIPKGTPGLIVALGGFLTVKYKVRFVPTGVGKRAVVVDRLTWRDVHEA